jgi:iron complex transport system permease protein
MKNAVRRAGFRPLRAGRCHLLLRPAALNIAAALIIAILLLASFGLTRGSFPLPAGTLRVRSSPRKTSANSRALSCLIFASHGC